MLPDIGVLRLALQTPVEEFTPEGFTRAWCSLSYLFPGLHPDGYDEEGSGWPCATLKFAAEAWRHHEAGEISEEVIYPSEAAWKGLHDRLNW